MKERDLPVAHLGPVYQARVLISSKTSPAGDRNRERSSEALRGEGTYTTSMTPVVISFGRLVRDSVVGLG